MGQGGSGAGWERWSGEKLSCNTVQLKQRSQSIQQEDLQPRRPFRAVLNEGGRCPTYSPALTSLWWSLCLEQGSFPQLRARPKEDPQLKAISHQHRQQLGKQALQSWRSSLARYHGIHHSTVPVRQPCPTLAPHALWPSRLLCHEAFQAGTLQWVAVSYSRGPPDPGVKPHLLCLLHGQADSIPLGATWEAHLLLSTHLEYGLREIENGWFFC